MKKLNLNPNEMAIRRIYWPLIKQGKIKTFFRPGVRLCTDYRGYCPDQNIKLKCLKVLGSDQLGIAPQFEKEEISVTIKHIYSKKIKDLYQSDFRGSSPELQSIIALKFHLGLIYNLSLEEITDEFYVTIINIEYSNDNKKNIMEKKRLENLLQNGLWKRSELAPENPKSLNGVEMITLVNHDYPVRSPLLWNSVFNEFNIPAKNIALAANNELDKEKIRWTLEVLRDDKRFKAGGLGVGLKDEALGMLDILDDSAANVGAANFIKKRKDGKLIGYNTDGEGFVMGLKENFSELKNLSGKKVLLLGSGGTANAIAFALVKAGADLSIINRTESKALALADKIDKFYNFSGENKVIAKAETELDNLLSELKFDLIINASTKGASGTWEDYSALASTETLESNLSQSLDRLKKMKGVIVADIVLRNEDTPLIKQAKELDILTIDGLPMVISQAAMAFSLSYGEEFEVGFSEAYQVMKKLF